MRKISVCMSILCLPFLIGCGGGGPALESVTGKVMNGDAPLTVGTVTFHPDKAKGNEFGQEPRAEVGSDGTYKIFTDGKEGCPAGWYKVTVIAEKPRPTEGEDAYAPPQYLVKKAYSQMESTPLSIEVTADAAEGTYDLKVDPN